MSGDTSNVVAIDGHGKRTDSMQPNSKGKRKIYDMADHAKSDERVPETIHREPFFMQSQYGMEVKSNVFGLPITALETPAAIVDAAVVRRNCRLMLDTAKILGISFRAHVKTHKTLQATAMQVGEEGPVNLVASTIREMKMLAPWLQHCQLERKREISLLYGVPASEGAIRSIAKLGLDSGLSHAMALMVDHPQTLDLIANEAYIYRRPVSVFVKIDTGYGRAGVKPESETLASICIKLAEPRIKEVVTLKGLYSHLGNSYAFDAPTQALSGLLTEFETLSEVAKIFFDDQALVLSVGATPTASAAQMLAEDAILEGNCLDDEKAEFLEAVRSADGDVMRERLTHEGLRDRWKVLKQGRQTLEIHAGVYPFLDMQQLATRARTSNLDYSDIGYRILTQVASLYPERSKPEALVPAGSAALGREPCKSYPGWGVVTPWSSLSPWPRDAHYTPENGRGWIVGRVSQEHGILTWEGDKEGMRDLSVGEMLMIWPNHACIAGLTQSCYYVVDSEHGDGLTIEDVWVRSGA